MEGQSAREIADLSAGDDLGQTTVEAFVVFFPSPFFYFFFFCCCADGALSHGGRCENTLEANLEAGNVGRLLISDRPLRLPNVVVIGGDSPGG